jgi:hypothetical protein
MSVTSPTLNVPPLLEVLVLVDAELLVEPEPLPLLLELVLLLLELPHAARARASTPAHRAISPKRPILPLTQSSSSCGTKAKPYTA